MKKIYHLLATGISLIASANAQGEFAMTAQEYKQECQHDLQQARDLFAKLENTAGDKTVKTVLEPLNDLYLLRGNSGGKANLFYNVHPDPEIRDLAKEQQQALSEIGTALYLSVPIYNALQEIEPPTNDPETTRVLKKIIRDYRRSGVDKPEAVREQIRQLKKELTELGQDFSKNMRDDVRYITLDSSEELAGLPDDYIEKHAPGADGKIRISTDTPDYFPFMRFAQNAEKRRELYMKSSNRGHPANEPVLKTLLLKRYELANLLGYRNYAEYITETKMIQNAGNIRSFIDRIAALARPAAEREYNELLARLQKMEPEAKKIDPWKAGYIGEILRREKYSVDAKEVRSYFPFGAVRDGILQLTSSLFGVTFRPWETATWHEDVAAYEMLEGDRVIGRFFLDLHPRENKYKHAAHFGILDGIRDRQIPTSALVCNLPGKGDDSELMEHSQVETFLHEFGHLLHNLFGGNQRWVYFSGIATERDFVEVPSQLLEEWIWNADVLKLISKNKNGEPLPEKLLNKMIAAKEFGKGLGVTGQMFLAAMSLNYYDCNPDTLDLLNRMVELQEKYSLYEHVPGTHKYANFGHLDGYSAIYYTYMWSLVIAKDFFSHFETEGLFNTKLATHYRKTILDPGGSKEANDLVLDFLGRPYSFDSFGQWLNKAATK